jgi:hypothetical protein
MNNLVQVNNQQITVREKRTELALMLKKVVIKLSRDEFEVVDQLCMLWINSKKCESLEEKALYVLIFVNLYRNRIMPQMLKVTPKITLSLSIPEAYSLNCVLTDIDLVHWPYEQSLCSKIMSEINKQTI